MERKRPWTGYIILVIITLIWGTTFAVTKSSLDLVPPLYFLAWRFSLAAVGLMLMNFRRLGSLTKVELISGTILGGSLSLGFIAQTVGMVYSTAAKAGFITGLAVVLVPVLGAAFFRLRVHKAVYISAVLAVAGLALLSLDFSFGISLNRGDVYLLICALAFAVNILNASKFAPRCRVLMLTMVQVAVTAVICWAAALLFEKPVPFTGQVWLSLIYLASVATIFTTAGQTWGLTVVGPERAALIFTLEPVFAAMFAMLLLKERLPAQGILGSILIMVAIIGAELASRKGKQRALE